MGCMYLPLKVETRERPKNRASKWKQQEGTTAILKAMRVFTEKYSSTANSNIPRMDQSVDVDDDDEKNQQFLYIMGAT